MTNGHKISPVTVEVMSWDGTRASIDALCWWVNEQWCGRHPLDEPIIEFEFTGPDDVQRPTFAQPNGDFEGMRKGDMVLWDGDEPILVRPTWQPT